MHKENREKFVKCFFMIIPWGHLQSPGLLFSVFRYETVDHYFPDYIWPSVTKWFLFDTCSLMIGVWANYHTGQYDSTIRKVKQLEGPCYLTRAKGGT